jgi:TonB family protein
VTTPLLDFVFDASVMLLIALGAMPLLRHRSAALRHLVLCTALVCAAAAPALESIVPAWRVPLALAADTTPAAPATSPAAGPARSVAAPTRAAEGPVSAAKPSPLEARTLLIGVWAAGGGALFALLLFGILRLVVITRRARPVADESWVTVVERMRQRYGIARRVTVLESDHPGLLLVWGWRRPALIIPSSARRWSSERIASVVSHELAHVGRNDWLTQMAAECIRAVHWFNPLVWIACGRLRRECEQACDDLVLAGGVEGSRYAADLLAIARDTRRGAAWMPAPAIVGTSTLERRVKAMLDRTTDRRPVTARTRNIALAMLLTTSIAVATLAATQQFASLTGTIVDPSNSLLPGVTLVLTNEETKAKYEIRTDSSGRYEFVGLPAGTYTLESKLPGFAKFNGTVNVAGKNVQQDMMLSVGEIEESITITGGAPEVLTAAQIEERQRRRQLEMEKVAEMMRKRAAMAGRTPAPSSGPRIGGNIRVPIKLRDARPRYPERMEGTDGQVVLNATIGTDGSVTHMEVASATHPEFADSATEAVKQWQFDATLLNGEAIETKMKVTLRYYWKP